MKVRVKEVVEYGGHSISANGGVNVTFKADYSELPNSIQLLQMLNNDVTIKAKVPNEGAIKLGYFRVKQVVIDDDGESKIKFNGLSDYIEVDNLNQLPFRTDDNAQFVIMIEADVELEDDGGDENDG